MVPWSFESDRDRCHAVGDALMTFSVDNSLGDSSDAVLRRREGVLVLEVRDLTVLRGVASDSWWCRRAAAFRAAGEVVRIEHDGLHVLTIGRDPLVHLGSWAGAAAVTSVPMVWPRMSPRMESDSAPAGT